ncbi:MAG: acyl-CoA dehydrogenase [Rhodobiaceae bacterium]|nr:MAG: acyl-CoA dehydrogenase [Rhodobiaceae bacterium]
MTIVGGEVMSFVKASECQAFRNEVREFLADELSHDLRAAGRETVGTHSAIDACRRWHHKLYKKGWIAPAWPVEHGGTGWTPEQRVVFERECAEQDAPILFAGGVRSIGPLLIEMGTEEQRRKYLPAILSGADLWCQGFSETGAGSDLAAVQTKADRHGADYVLTGSKIWTTGAHLSNRMFCLVRTRKSDRPQNGISFLLLDMDTPGVSVEPIIMLNGEHEFNQVRFEEARVPLENLVGSEHEGWSVAKVLMRHARISNTTGGQLHRALNAVRRTLTGSHMTPEPGLARKIQMLMIELEAFDVLEIRCRRSVGGNCSDRQARATASFLKTVATELNQKIAEVGMQIGGPYAISDHSGCEQSSEEAAIGGLATSKYLGLRAASIYSGTNEIHRNMLAHHIEGKNLLVAQM